MTLERCYSSIDRYLNREDESAPRFVNVESVEDMVAIVDHYNVGENIFLTVEKYSSEDENPRIEDLLNDLATLQGNIFLTGFTTCWKLIGAKELSSQLTAIAQMSVEGHVVVLCFQCRDYLSFRDSRLNRLVYSVDGVATPKPHIVFVNPMLQVTNEDRVEGIQNLPAFIETTDADTLHVKTKHHPEEYPYALFRISEEANPYNLLLPARSEKIESVDMSGAFAYFIDAMGVEFLGYISEKSKQKKLLPKITVCRSELPSITSRNKEFLDVFAEHNVQCKSIKQIDDIKHHGAENFTLENSPYPTHLIRELEIIDHVLDLIKLDLAKGKYTKAILVSDHGASRLVVLKNQLIDGEFDAKGTHCGRVCAYTEQTGSMPMIVQAGENDEYAVVANYERFKPGRLMGVEVHGGATLEEVTVPIIELSYVPGDIEIIVQTPLVMSSIRKPPIIEFYSTTKIDNIVVNVGNTEYKANTTDGHSFSIEMSKRTRANTYTADVYAGGTMIATGLEFRVEKEGFKSNDIL